MRRSYCDADQDHRRWQWKDFLQHSEHRRMAWLRPAAAFVCGLQFLHAERPRNDLGHVSRSEVSDHVGQLNAIQHWWHYGLLRCALEQSPHRRLLLRVTSRFESSDYADTAHVQLGC